MIHCASALIEAVDHNGRVNQDHRADLSPFVLQRARDFDGSEATSAKAANVNGPPGASATNLLDIGADHIREVVDHCLSAIHPIRVDGIDGTLGPERICE